MKAVILAGGLGTRLAEETTVRPKPMVEIGGHPMLWHIMKIYSTHGINDFVVCLGYKGEVIKEYFANFCLRNSDVVFDLQNNQMEIQPRNAEPWRVTCIDTGQGSMTGGRLKRVGEYLDDDEPFFFTYGDGLADIDLRAQLEFHRRHGKWATITAVQPPGRYGALEMDHEQVLGFMEKPRGDGGLINGGFFVLDPSVIELIPALDTHWEQEPLEALATSGELVAFRHTGFWQPMDTLRDRLHLEDLWQQGAPWKCW